VETSLSLALEKFVRRPRVGALLLVAALIHGPAYGQLTTGTIAGTVNDETGAAVPGAAVTVANVATGLSREIVTNDRGRYEATNLPAGVYDVTATMPRFGTAVRKGIDLAVGRNAVVDLSLPLASVQEDLVVTGDAPLVETTTATVSSLIGAKAVEDLPLVNRDLTQLTFLQPGVIKSPAGPELFAGMGDKFTVAGARGTQNLYLLDGVSNADLSGNPQGVSGSYSGAETVQEIQIVTNNYSAEYRSAAGGIVSAITKSGTNTVHGSLFEFYRGDALDSQGFFDRRLGNPKPDFSRHQFGGSVGGPIRRNKVFFFGSYEGLRADRDATDQGLVPSVAIRQGRFANGRQVAVHPTSAKILSLHPVPGQGNTIVDDFGDVVLIAATATETTDSDFAVGKIDYQLNGGNTLSGTYNFEKGELTEFGVNRTIGGLGTKTRKHVTSVKWTSVVSRASVNEFHFGYSQSEPQGDLPISDFDFVGEGLVWVPDKDLMGDIQVPEIESIGFSDGGSSYGQRSYTLKDGYSLSKGNHSYRLGGEWTYFQYDVASCPGACHGDFFFADLDRFLAGIPRRLEILLPGNVASRDLRQHLLGVYVQDNWRATNTLTLNMGLRYEFASVPSEVEDRVGNLVNPQVDSEVTLGVLFKNPTKKSFSPRIGFAWAPGDGRMSVRGGFGIFYDHPMLFNIRTSLQELPPFTLVGRIDQADANAVGQQIDFPNAYQTQLALAEARPNIRTFQYDLDQTHLYRWSLTLQRQFGQNWVASADYTGSSGRNLWQQSQANINRWQGWPEQPPPGTPKFFPAGTGPINPAWGEMRVQYPNSDSSHHGGSFGLQRRLNAGLQLGAAFTFGKTIDSGSTVTGDGFARDQRGIYGYDPDFRRGRASYDVPKSFSASVTYAVPFGNDLAGIAGLFAKGWQVNTIVTLRDGFPLSVEAKSANQQRRIGDDEQLRPNLIPGGDNNPVTGDPDRWFDVSQFTPPELGFFGDVGRNTVDTPGYAAVDLSVFKNVALGSSTRLQVRIETFNLFNRANFGVPNMDAFINERVNPTAGRITTTRPPRQMQLGVRWIF
jgi:Carboxypeptidase regulatory-like domain/TonB dependent receptor-like, beta-barrel/TonB-dependent Receptor Plug Domain